MSDILSLREHNLHKVRVGERTMMLHIPTNALYGIDEMTDTVLERVRAESLSADQLVQQLRGRFDEQDLRETVGELLTLDLLSDGRPAPAAKPVTTLGNLAINTVVLNVNTGCNLSCTYCYKEDLDTPDKGRRMSLETAKQSIELMLSESPNEKRFSVVFFGGEPLSNLKLIRAVVDYCEARFAQLGKQMDFVMTTNATLLTDEIVDWLDAHRFGLSISMDGPEAIHDRNRRTVGGKGTYRTVSDKARKLLARYHARPVG
ncbi:MAG: radical SAM protein, partial [Arenimonas sp.]|nr:radical SAM protein [Arenimonas sp.]